MTVATYALSAPLIAESLLAPLNLWRGRTIGNWYRFTGLDARIAHRLAAPAKLTTAALLIAGLVVRSFGVVGAAAALAIAVFYLVRLAYPGRRAADGIVAFTLFGLIAGALLAIQLLR